MRILLLNSTQGKRPHAGLPWVRATLAAVESLCQSEHRFICSTGMMTWELVLWAAARRRCPLHVLCPLPRKTQRPSLTRNLEEQFRLQECDITWEFLDSTRATGRQKDTWAKRDELAMTQADLIVPISIRPAGRLEQALRQPALQPKTTHEFLVEYQVDRPENWLHRSHELPSDLPEEPMLIHFTRSWDGPWPGETSSEFYEALSTSPTYPRDASATLGRILKERVIRASGVHIRGKTPAVCFTHATPKDSLALVRWRRRYARHAFEPYAIALSMKAALQAGIRPVRYENSSSKNPDPFRQGRGPEDAWLSENEWRKVGELDLNSLDLSNVLVLTATPSEAETMRTWCPHEVKSFGLKLGLTKRRSCEGEALVPVTRVKAARAEPLQRRSEEGPSES